MSLHGLGVMTVGLAMVLAACGCGARAAEGPAASPTAGEAAAVAAGEPAAPASMFVYIGGRSRGKPGGITRCRLDLATGALAVLGVTGDVSNPSWLALHPGGRFLYTVNEVREFGGQPAGGLSAFAVAPGSGDLTLLNQASSKGAGPCHAVVDARGRYVLAANYGGGSVVVVPIGGDGRLGEATAFVQHEGKSVDPRRQAGPHAHCANLDAANRFALVADLGLDKVLVYRFDAQAGTLAPNDPPFATLPPGSGPRHVAFHPGGRFVHVVNELTSTVTAFRYDAAAGRLEALQTISALPEGFAEPNSGAEVAVHPSGRFLYTSNRGHDSIAIFAIDAGTGRLTAGGHASTQGKTPRNFALDPTGRYLLAANQGSGTVVAFRIDGATGRLEPTGHALETPGPMCVAFLAGP